MWKAGLIDLSELICFLLPALPPSLSPYAAAFSNEAGSIRKSPEVAQLPPSVHRESDFVAALSQSINCT